MDRPDLNAYFNRIGYSAGAQAPTLETLRALHLHHAQAIAFENLNPLAHLPVPLDLASLEQKLVRSQRGGYCFEQNILFKQVLQELGFRVQGLAARVVWNQPEGAIRMRSHMLLRVDIGDEPYIADVGFGGMTLTGPLRLATDVAQRTPHETFRLIEQDGDFLLQVRLQESWRQIYRFDLQPQHLVDYEVPNWYVSNHPQSRFVTNLVAARAAPGRRYALLNDTLTIHELEGRSEEHKLHDVTEIRAALETNFGLQLGADRTVIEAAIGSLIR